jgi:hypothetical protein
VAQVTDAELPIAATRQELPSGPTGDIDGEPGLAFTRCRFASLGNPAVVVKRLCGYWN